MRRMYIHKKIFVLGLSATLVTGTLVACSSKSNNANSESSDAVESTEISEDAEASKSLYAMVQSIDGNSITAIKGDLNTDVLEDQTPPSGGGTTFVEGTDTITFTVTDDTAITIEFLQGSEEGTIENITVNSVLELTLDENNNATSIIVKNLQSGGGFGGSSTVTNGTSANTIDSDSEITDEKYTSTGDDENALRVDGATVTIDNATVNTTSVNGNDVFSYGEGTTLNISNSTIRTTNNNSGGIQTTGGGTTNATNLDVQTEGNSSAAIRSDRGGGNLNVAGGSYVTNGTGSPAIYSTANIVVSDAALGDATFTMNGGSLTSKNGDLFYVTNTNCDITLSDVALTLDNDNLLTIAGNSSSRGWGTEGSNGGNVNFIAESQTMEGNITCDSISTINMTMKNATNFKGTINKAETAGTVSVTIDDNSTWTLTGDSYKTSFDGDLTNINMNGYHLYVNGEQVA